jgi:FAD:protein FMN transferase
MEFMTRRAVWFIVGVFATSLGVGVARSYGGDTEYVFHHENVMGTSLELRVRAETPEGARWAEDRVLGEIDRLSAVFSSYDPQSEFSGWQTTTRRPTLVSSELFEVLQASDKWRMATAGAFNPRVELLTRLWSSCAKQNRRPTADEIAKARELMRQPAWRLDPATGAAEHLSTCPLSLNSIAKGYIIGKACEAALDRTRGIRGLVLNVGGDVRVCGERSCTIAIAAPQAHSETSEPLTYIEVRNRSVATSGNYQRGFRIGDHWFSHIFDPRSGIPVEQVVSATVIAENAADANALATTFNVLSVEESLRLAKTLRNIECKLVTSDGCMFESDGWRGHERPPVPALAFAGRDDPRADDKASARVDVPKGAEAKPNAGSSWRKDFEVVVNFEINGPEGANMRRYRRPYVAVWVENKDGFPVRTLSLWVQNTGKGPRWIPDLRGWYRSDKARRMMDESDLVVTVSRATRQPGKYSVNWDGTDDHGKPLESGEYTIFIEAAREHGTYQSIRKQVTLSDKPFVEELKGNVEIKSASIEYRRKSSAK